MPWMPFLLRWWRVGLYGLAALALGLAVWRVTVWHRAYEALPEAQAALSAEVACQVPSKCAERVAALTARQDAITEKVVSDYESELESLRNRPRPAGPVRLCRPRPDPGDVHLPGATAATDPDGGAELQVEVGRNIADELYRLADDADAEALKLRALWARDRALSQPAQ